MRGLSRMRTCAVCLTNSSLFVVIIFDDVQLMSQSLVINYCFSMSFLFQTEDRDDHNQNEYMLTLMLVIDVRPGPPSRRVCQNPAQKQF